MRRNIRNLGFPSRYFLQVRIGMAKTRRAKGTKRVKRAKRTKKARGGGESCYGKNSYGNDTTWSCTTQCGEKETCNPVD